MRGLPRTRSMGLVLLTVAMLVSVPNVFGVGIGAGEDDGWSVFHFAARRHPASPKLFPKWDDVQRRTVEAGPDGPPCTPDNFRVCHYQKLQAIAEKARRLPDDQRLQFVQDYVNRLPYIPDIDLYGVSDYWATQFQFYASDGGDCEDYSISKYYALKLLGYDPSNMHVVILRDTNLQADHAVLVVAQDGRQWLLDNNLDKVVDTARVHHMLPYYALNERSWWSFLGVPQIDRN